MLKITRLELEGVLLLEYDIKQDHRAVFHRTYAREALQSAGVPYEFAEEIAYHPVNQGTLYGIHYQNHPKAQSKLIYCGKGRIMDYAVDLRKNSETYGKWLCIELTAENKKQLYIPEGFGHAALTLENNSSIIMRINTPFDPALSKAISYLDPDLAIPFGVTDPILSEQDATAPRLKDADCNM